MPTTTGRFRAGLGAAAACGATLLAACSSTPSQPQGGVLGLSTSFASPSATAATGADQLATAAPTATPLPATPAPTPARTPSPPPTRRPTPVPTPRPVVSLTAPVPGPVTVHLGSILRLRFAGSTDDPWQSPTDTNPGVLAVQSVSVAGGSLDASFLAKNLGSVQIQGQRVPTCPPPSPGQLTGVCGAIAYAITVVVVR